jgi:hypothetical protein
MFGKRRLAGTGIAEQPKNERRVAGLALSHAATALSAASCSGEKAGIAKVCPKKQNPARGLSGCAAGKK